MKPLSGITQIPRPKIDAWRTFLFSQARVLDELDRELRAEAGLSLSWYDVLIQLHEGGGSVRAGDLARSLLISASAGTRLIDRMEKRGLVLREACAEDRRVTFVKLSDEGRAALSAATPVHMAGIERHFTRFLSRSDAQGLKAILDPILEAHS